MRTKLLKLLCILLVVLVSCIDQDEPSKTPTLQSTNSAIPLDVTKNGNKAGRPLSDNCDDGHPCPSGYTCVNGFCRAPGCTPVSCPIGQTCTGGICTGVPCPCGGNYYGDYNTINSYYAYPIQTSTVNCSGDFNIKIICYAIDIPNRFTIYDQSNNILYATPWIGTATYPGPWGMSLAVTTSYTIPPIYHGSITSVKIFVETVTPPDYSYSPSADHWQVTVGCEKI